MMCCLKACDLSPAWQLVACLLAAISAGPLGVLLVLRRMTLMADGLAHGILPGLALATAWLGTASGLSRLVGACVSLGLVGLVHLIARRVRLGVEAVFAGMVLWFMALGFWLSRGKDLHFLSGHMAALSYQDFGIIAGVCLLTTTVCVVGYRHFLLSACDPHFYRHQYGNPAVIENILLTLITLNLWALCPMLGSLMSVAFMILPALIMRLWTHWIPGMMVGAVALSIAATSSGNLKCPHGGWGVIVTLGCVFVVSCVVVPWIQSRKAKRPS